jgi:Helix-turn-helix domain
MDDLLTVAQAATIYKNVGENTIRHWIKKSKPREAWVKGKRVMLGGDGFFNQCCRKIGARIYINREAFEEFLKPGKNP